MERLSYRPDIDGLRAIAVIAVVLYHFFPGHIPGGLVGVDVFFVISGYLISKIIISDVENKSFSLIVFYSRRLKRITPPLLLIILFVCLVSWFFFTPYDLSRLGYSIIGSSLSLQNIILLNESGYFDVSSNIKPLLHIWSLGVEEQFYVLWPLIILSLARTVFFKRGVFLLFLLSFSSCVWFTFKNHDMTFYFPFFRAWELSAGCLVAMLEIKFHRMVGKKTIKNVSLISLFICFFIISGGNNFPGYVALAPVLFTSLLILLGGADGFASKFLSLPTMSYIGKLSYPLYLWHWPLLSFYYYISFEDPKNGSASIKMFIILISFLMACITYHLLERRLIKNKPLLKVAGISLSMLIITSMWGAYLIYSNGAPYRYNQEEIKVLNPIDFGWHSAVRIDKCHIELDDDRLNIEKNRVERCLAYGPKNILLWGDSFAASLYPGVKYLADKSGYTVSQITGANRPPLMNYSANATKQFNETMIFIKKAKPDFVLIEARWMSGIDQREFIKKEIFNTIQEVRKNSPNSRIVIFGKPPEWRANLQRIISRSPMPGGTLPKFLDGRLTKGQLEFDSFMNEISMENKAEYVSLYKSFCKGESCMVRVGDAMSDITVIDDAHLSPSASRYAVMRESGKIFN